MAVSWYAVVVLVATALGASIGPEKQVLEKSSCGRVWVTVHSLDINLGNREVLTDALELNWDFASCNVVPKQIGLFDERPGSWDNALQVFPIDAPEGYVITSKSLGEPALPAGWDKGPGLKGPHCLWPWVGAGNDSVSAYNCLKIQPTWMEDHPEINKLRVRELALAGTHNSGAWRFDTENSTVARDRFVLCQDRSIWAQLVHGIRYFDFRVAYHDSYSNEDDRYWLNHDSIKIRPLVPLLKEIRTFLDSTKEIVFLDVHRFPIGFEDPDGSPIRAVHQGLINLVQRELGPHLAYARDFGTGAGTRGPTVQSLLDADKRLLFSYVDHEIVEENDWLWPPVLHLWATTHNPNELFTYLDQEISFVYHNSIMERSPMYSAMAQTTPSFFDVISPWGSLRKNADAVNRKVTQRLQTRWRPDANIVSTNFFLGNDVVDVSIAISLERGRSTTVNSSL